jgi:hypothetical protein
MTVATDRPDYVIAITPNSPGPLENPRAVMLRGTRSGKPGNSKEGAEAVARSQAPGSMESYNWLIDTDGTVFELTGWERAAWSMKSSYVVGLAQATAADLITDRQYASLDWLMQQIEHKKQIGRGHYTSRLGPGFEGSRVGL